MAADCNGSGAGRIDLDLRPAMAATVAGIDP